MSSNEPGRPSFNVNCLYFTYGSNLHVRLMAQRCPNSAYVGPATLPGYRLIIDQTGGASIIYSQFDQVEGLVYTITPEDEETLHQLGPLGVLGPLDPGRFLRVICRDYGQYSGLKSYFLAQRLETPPAHLGPLLQVGDDRFEQALVYNQEEFQSQGPASESFRLANRAVIDAILLGVPKSFFDATVIPYLPQPASTAPGPASTHDSVSNETVSSNAKGKMVSNESNAHGMFPNLPSDFTIPTIPPSTPTLEEMTSGPSFDPSTVFAMGSEPGGSLAPQVPYPSNNPSPPLPEATLSMTGMRLRIRDDCAALGVPFVLASLENDSCVPVVPEQMLEPVYVVQVIKDLAWSETSCKVATVTHDMILANKVALVMLQGVLEEAMNVNPDDLIRVLTDDWFRMAMGGEVDEGVVEQSMEEGCLRLVANLGRGRGRVGIRVVKHQIVIRADVVDSEGE